MNGRLLGVGGLERQDGARGKAQRYRCRGIISADPVGFAGAPVAFPNAGDREFLLAGGRSR